MKPVIKYALAALLLLASSSHASTIWSINSFSQFFYGETPALACDLYADYRSKYVYQLSENTPTNYTCGVKTDASYSAEQAAINLIDIQCPSGFTDNGSGQCVAGNAYSCLPNRAMFATVTKQEDGTFPDTICQPQTSGGTDYCAYGSSDTLLSSDNTINALYTTASEAQYTVKCDTPTDEVETLRLPFSPNSFTGQLTEQDTRIVESDDNFSAPNTVCVSNGDGTDTCTTISQQTQNTVEGKGTVTTSDGTKATITTHNGNTTSTTETTTATDDGHGTSQTTTQKTVSTTTGGSSSSTFDSSTGSTTTSSTPDGDTFTQTTTTTTTTNPDGSTTTTTTTDTATTEPDASKEGNCGSPGQPSCVITLEGQDSLGSVSDALDGSGINGQLDGFIEEIGNIGESDISSTIIDITPFQLPTTGVCNPSAYSVDFHGEDFNPMTTFCEIYDDSLHPAFRFLLYGLTLFALYNIYLRTLSRTS